MIDEGRGKIDEGCGVFMPLLRKKAAFGGYGLPNCLFLTAPKKQDFG
jgi:hypothetical protein